MMTTAEVAKKYGLTLPTVWQAVVEGRIPSVSIPLGTKGRSMHLIDPKDAEDRWGGNGTRPGPKPRERAA